MYKIKVSFNNGQELNFETRSNIKDKKYRKIVNGEDCIVTDEDTLINMRHVKEINMVKK